MQRYANRGGTSPIVAYTIDKDSITVRFGDGFDYVYNVQSAGRPNLVEMQRLATEGVGLAAYISRHTRQRYAKKIQIAQ